MTAERDWFDQAVGWSGIVGALLTVVALGLAVGVALAAVQNTLFGRMRRRSVVRTIRRHDVHVPRRRAARATRELLERRASSGPRGVAEEAAWLGELADVDGLEDVRGLSETVSLPVTFAVSADRRAALFAALAAAYDDYAAMVRRRWLLRSAAGGRAEEEYVSARQAARWLRRESSVRELPAPSDPEGLRGRWLDLRGDDGARRGRRRVRMLTWPDQTAARGALTFSTVVTDYVPYRVVVTGATPTRGAVVPPRLREVPDVARRMAADGTSFDGVMTRLHGTPGFRLDFDIYSGRQRLTLCVSETSYFAFEATQRPSHARAAGEAALRARVLTLNLLLVDENRRLFLAQKADGVVYGGTYAGSAGGNCELVPREGIHGDFDEFGFPDPMAALAREAREELGLDVTGGEWNLAALGLIELDSEAELGTTVLTVRGRLPMSARDLRIMPGSPDAVEGEWELGETAMVIDIAAVVSDPTGLRLFVRWVRSTDELAPNAVGGILLLLLTDLNRPRRPGDSAATTADLAAALKEPAPAVAPRRRPEVVTVQPLWQRSTSDSSRTNSRWFGRRRPTQA